MFVWLYSIWEERQHKTTPFTKLEFEIIELNKKIEETNKQINNIYEILEVLTNESKTKYLNEFNDVSKENDDKPT